MTLRSQVWVIERVMIPLNEIQTQEEKQKQLTEKIRQQQEKLEALQVSGQWADGQGPSVAHLSPQASFTLLLNP